MISPIGKYLSVELLVRPKGRKTDFWRVTTRSGELGRVRWFSPWRQYVFDPAQMTIFSRECLIDLATFLEDINRRHRAAQG